MKRGLEYALSAQKRSFDVAVAVGLTPVSVACRTVVTLDLLRKNAEELSATFEQDRIGQGGESFVIKKIRTLNPLNGQPYSRLAWYMRKLGLDETAQAANIFEGTMSAAGYRPLISEEYEESMDSMTTANQRRWGQVIGNTKPGIVSSFALYYHEHPEPDPNFADLRAEMDYRDFVEQASLAHDIKMLLDIATSALSSRLQ